MGRGRRLQERQKSFANLDYRRMKMKVRRAKVLISKKVNWRKVVNNPTPNPKTVLEEC